MSLLQEGKRCYICGAEYGLHKHHIFFGPNRKLSDQDGCVVWLCRAHHTGPQGVHFNRDLDLKLKWECQQAWQELNGTEEDFIKKYGKSYCPI